MTPVPAPSVVFPQEEWADADFDLPEGAPLNVNTHSDAESDNEAEDWDVEMELGPTGGAKATLASSPLASTPRTFSTNMITIRPPLNLQAGDQADDEDDFDVDDEGASTIKISHMPPIPLKTPPSMDNDIEAAFELPSELSQLSLRPLQLHHRISKTSLEWGDRDHTSSSNSSDAYSTLGFGPSASPSSNSTSAPSVGDLETDDDDDEEGELDGLVFPASIVDSGHGGRHFSKILEAKKRLPVVQERSRPTTLDSEDDFEIGLVIDDDLDLSPSRLPSNRNQAAPEKKTLNRSKSVPPRPPVVPFRPSSRLGGSKDRSKSPSLPTSAMTRHFRPLALPPPNIPRPTLTRKTTLQTLSPAPSSFSVQASTSTSAPLRAQKSHAALKPPSPRSSLARKASLCSLIDIVAAAGVGLPPQTVQSPTSYAAPTAASRARTQAYFATTQPAQSSHQYYVPPTRPSTPSTSTAALRLTMPTSSSRAKIRPAISSVFGSIHTKNKDGRASPSSRPSSTASSGSSSNSKSQNTQTATQSAAPKILRRPKRARLYGDGTELDGIEDLPTDKEREKRYRVVPRGAGTTRGVTKIEKASPEKEKALAEKDNKGTLGRKKIKAPVPSTNTLRRKDRIDFNTPKPPPIVEPQSRKTSRKKLPAQMPSTLPGGTTKRKPTLIRNLGGAGAPKVVGDMKWNPQTLRWEGNEHALRDFDAVVASSTRPALITHLTGSSIGSPVGAGSFAAAGARVVGNMIFDPSRMCWISRLPPEEDEPDVFAGLADDEDDWESRGGTIRASTQTNAGDSSLATAATRGETPSPGRPSSSHTRAMSESGSERGSRPALRSLQDVDGKLLERCRIAEDRHRAEMKGWRLPPDANRSDSSALFEIRALATRQY
ncbi:hypothetical protein BU17DRAFT_41935 [Hysterangium stoloniferum]|nr:hypothetical protein BU17DRAFT_41935 [Hysterangium stoloniferum]